MVDELDRMDSVDVIVSDDEVRKMTFEELDALFAVPPVEGPEEPHVAVPTTLYDAQGGVAGVALPSGEFIQAEGTRVGKTIQVWDERLGRKVEMEVGWDGAVPEQPTVVADELGIERVAKGKSKGLLLGEYPLDDSLWRTLKIGGPGWVVKQHREGRGAE